MRTTTENRIQELLTLPAIVMWLERKPPHETYNYCDVRSCLIAQYLRDMCISNVIVCSSFVVTSKTTVPIPLVITDVARPGGTFAEALQRAKTKNAFDDA